MPYTMKMAKDLREANRQNKEDNTYSKNCLGDNSNGSYTEGEWLVMKSNYVDN